MKFDAPVGQLNWKGRGMRPLLRATLNRLVGNKPCIATTARVASARVRPARDVAFVLIRNTEREAVDVDLAIDGEVKNVLVAVVQKSFRTDRFEMSERAFINRDRFDPVNRVLENEQVAQLKNNFVRKHRI